VERDDPCGIFSRSRRVHWIHLRGQVATGGTCRSALSHISTSFLAAVELPPSVIGCFLSGIIMNAMLVSVGTALPSSVDKNETSVFGISLLRSGGPAIAVLTKFVCVVALVNNDRHSWYLLGLTVLYVGVTVAWLVYTGLKRHETIGDMADVLITRVLSSRIDDGAASPEPAPAPRQPSQQATEKLIEGPSSEEV